MSAFAKLLLMFALCAALAGCSGYQVLSRADLLADDPAAFAVPSSLEPGRHVRVDLDGGGTVEGEVIAVERDALRVRILGDGGAAERAIPAGDVARIQERKLLWIPTVAFGSFTAALVYARLRADDRVMPEGR